MCISIVDIQFATTEIRRGKKEEETRKKLDENMMSASAIQGGHNKFSCTCTLVILFVLVCCEVEFNDPVAYIQ